MNVELYIAKRILGDKNSNQTTKSITKIAQIGIAAGICVMLMSIFITSGFKHQITEKITGTTAEITLQPASLLEGWSDQGKTIPDSTLAKLSVNHQVACIYPSVSKAVVFKGKDELHGAIITGYDSSAPLGYIKNNIIEGQLPDFSKQQSSQEIVISEKIARMINAKLGDKILAYFISNETRVRQVTICGIVSTGMKEIDDTFALCDVRLLQRLNQWETNEFDTYSIKLKNGVNDNEFATEIDKITNNNISGDGWIISTLQDKYPAIFDWLELLDMNVWVILILLSFVAGFNMISSLLILILERSTFVGIMKSTGVSDINMRKIFLWISSGLIGKGMLWGNIVGFSLALLQNYFHIIRLNPEIYYMDYVPIVLNLSGAIILNIGVMIITLIMMIIPTTIISKIDPIKVIRFD